MYVSEKILSLVLPVYLLAFANVVFSTHEKNTSRVSSSLPREPSEELSTEEFSPFFSVLSERTMANALLTYPEQVLKAFSLILQDIPENGNVKGENIATYLFACRHFDVSVILTKSPLFSRSKPTYVKFVKEFWFLTKDNCENIGEIVDLIFKVSRLNISSEFVFNLIISKFY